MTPTDGSSERQRSGSSRAVWLRVFAGIGLGLLTYWLLALWPSVAIALPMAESRIHPVTLLVLGAATLGAAFVGVRWPIVGIAAGATVLAVVLYALGFASWPGEATSVWDFANLRGYGAVSATPTMIGVVFLASALLRAGRLTPRVLPVDTAAQDRG